MADSAGKECMICFDPFTAKLRSVIKCINSECDFECCKRCFEDNYLKSQEFNLVTLCCKKPITLNQIAKITGNLSYGKKILQRYTENVIESQKNILPESQEEARRLIEYRKAEEWRKEQWTEIRRLKQVSDSLRDKIYRSYGRNNLKEGEKEKNEYTFIKECSREECKGMLSSGWKCGLCEKFTCSKCHLPKECQNDPGHVCDENAVKNIEAIKKDSKSCPSCGTGIFKINGCDQMWCVNCKTTFSWKTGKINTSTYVHNPEYFRFMRDNNLNIPRAPGDNPGVRPFDLNECFNPFDRNIRGVDRYFHGILKNSIGEDWRRSNIAKLESVLMRLGRHTNSVVLHIFRFDLEEILNRLRIKYLVDDIDEIKWKKYLATNIKKSNRRELQYQIADSFLKILADVYRNILIIIEGYSIHGWKLRIEEQVEIINNYIQICNVEFTNIRKLFGSSELIFIKLSSKSNLKTFSEDIDEEYTGFLFQHS